MYDVMPGISITLASVDESDNLGIILRFKSGT